MNSPSVIVDDEVSICSDTAASYIHKALQARDKEKCIHAFYYSRIGPSHGYIQHYVKVIFDCKINSYDQNCFSKSYKYLAIIKQRSICEGMIGDARGGGQKYVQAKQGRGQLGGFDVAVSPQTEPGRTPEIFQICVGRRITQSTTFI